MTAARGIVLVLLETSVPLRVAAQTTSWVAEPESVMVGDTVLLVRDLPVAPDARWQLHALERSRSVEPLGDPIGRYSESRLTVAYRAAAFAPGRVPVVMPDVELVRSDESIEVVAGDTAWITVRSVLPPTDSLPAPMPALDPIERPRRSRMPLLGSAAVALFLVTTWAWWLRRTRTGGKSDSNEREGTVEPPLEDWIAAGELRAAATVAADRLRDHIARIVTGARRHLATEELIGLLQQECADWPLRELADVLRGLERARFAPAIGDDVLSLVEQARALEERLVQPAGDVPAEVVE